MKTAFLFPAFISEFIGNEIEILFSYTDGFNILLEKASDILHSDLTNLSLDNEALTKDELSSQVISYIFSCCLSDVLAKKEIKPDILAGYSMGLYGALYCGGAISFEEGIRLIQKAFLLSKEAIKPRETTMGSIIGLTASEISGLISANKLDVEIANTNSIHSYLIAGATKDIDNALNMAREMGALSTSVLVVGTPYHSRLLEPATALFKTYLQEQVVVKDSNFPILSSINQQMIKKAEDLISETANNLCKPINWMNSFNYLLANDYSRMIECGAGKSLQKISRFTTGDFTIYPMNKLKNLLG